MVILIQTFLIEKKNQIARISLSLIDHNRNIDNHKKSKKKKCMYMENRNLIDDMEHQVQADNHCKDMDFSDYPLTII